MKRMLSFLFGSFALFSALLYSPIVTQASTTEPYYSVIEDYYVDIGFTTMDESSQEKCKGLLYDLNGDGQEELILQYLTSSSKFSLHYGVWTIQNGTPVCVLDDPYYLGSSAELSYTTYEGNRYLVLYSLSSGSSGGGTAHTFFKISNGTYQREYELMVQTYWDDSSEAEYYINDKYVSKSEYDKIYQCINNETIVPLASEGIALDELMEVLNTDGTSTAENGYLDIVQEAITFSNNLSYGGRGNAILYDVDGNGVDELILAHPFIYDQYMDCTAYSIYTMDKGRAVPLVVRESLLIYAGAPYGEISIVEKDGEKYIAVYTETGETGDEVINRNGTWWFYTVNGSALDLVEKIDFEYAWGSEGIIYSESYAESNGKRYLYSELEDFIDGLHKLVTIDAGFNLVEPNSSYAYTLKDLRSYLRNVPESDNNGLVEVNGVWGYYIDGVLQVNYTGFVKEEGIYYYVQNGILDREFYGLVCVDGHWRYVEEGYVTWKYKGLAEYNGEYFYIEQSSINWEYTGFVLHEGVYYYIQNGHLDFGFSGLVCIDGHWRYVEEGRITWKYKGLGKYDGEYFYIENSSVNWEYTGFVLHKDVYYYIQNGHLDWSFSGLVCIDGHWRYVEGGLITWKYNGLGRYNGEYFYIENSSVNWEYTGLVWHNDRYYYIENGHLDWSFWGLVYKSGNWWYVENGYVTGNYTGLAKKGGEYFYVKNSVLDWSYTGLLEHSGKMYYIQNGHLDWSYTGLGYHKGDWLYIYGGRYKEGYSGLVYFNNNWFYVEDSLLTWENHGLHEHDGKLYYLNHSQVDWSYNGPAHYKGVVYDVVNGVAEL